MSDKRVRWEIPSEFQGGVTTEGLCDHVRILRQN